MAQQSGAAFFRRIRRIICALRCAITSNKSITQEASPTAMSFLPGTVQSFGGTSSAEYEPLLLLAYPAANGAAT
jgi:hypothetical protein